MLHAAQAAKLDEAIDRLYEVADVHVMIIPGYHDRESVMHLGDT